MEDYKSNSHRSKELAKTENPVATKKDIQPIAKAKTKKKNKLVDTFISEDAQNIKSYILMDVLVPAIKKAVSDIVTDGISMLLYGDTSHGNKRSISSASYVSYNRYSDRREEPRTTRSGYSYDDTGYSSPGGTFSGATGTTSSYGGDSNGNASSFNIMNPYITKYCWERID